MKRSALRGLLISDFNLGNLSGYLSNDPSQPEIQCEMGPYGLVAEALLDSDLPCWKPVPDFLIVWTRPEAVLPSVRHVLDGFTAKEGLITEEVSRYSEAIAAWSQSVKTIFVPTWNIPTIHFGQGLLDLAQGAGVSRCVMHANMQLLRDLDTVPNAFVLNASKWIELVGEGAFSERLWYLAKIPFAHAVFKAAGQDIKAALRGIRGEARKLVVLDLDDVLWGGIVGEIGWQNIILGGHDSIGEAFVDFQRALKSLRQRGVLLAIASKNEEAVAWEAFKKHPEMILREGDFAAWRINWKDKAQNIADIAAELSLGLDAVVFIDDNQIERDRVRQALPEILVPDWPLDRRLYVRSLYGLNCFQQAFMTDEDRFRAEMYSHERARKNSRAYASSLEEWLQTLQLRVKVEPLGDSNLPRATQLLNKTNQMNLSTRRLTEKEFKSWATEAGHHTWVFYVSDRFGDSGLTGILSIEADGNRSRIVDFVLSCRVIGRKVEETMLHCAVEWARRSRIRSVVASYSETPRNAPCRAFFQKSGLITRGKDQFAWDADHAYELPSAITLVSSADGAPFEVFLEPRAVEVTRIGHEGLGPFDSN
jgi:FkbH-like protein